MKTTLIHEIGNPIKVTALNCNLNIWRLKQSSTFRSTNLLDETEREMNKGGRGGIREGKVYDGKYLVL